jgi:Holliday junction resolvasome RuvABC endonuclease subunit
MILALDLGTKTGWAAGTEWPTDIVSGVENWSRGRFTGGGMRYLNFKHWLGKVHDLFNVEEVYFEEVRRHMSTDAAHAYGGFMSHLTVWCEENEIPYQGVPVGTIKKDATGNGNASKDMMIAAAQSWGFKPKDDNEADALAILRWRLAQPRVSALG